MKEGLPFGLHRVVSPQGVLPQAATNLDATSDLYDNEVRIIVDTLNVDSASFHQIVGDVGKDEEKIAERIRSIVAERGKMQNPVTGSGGMLLGTIAQVGPNYEGNLEAGDRIATLVSLTLTPLKIDAIKAVHINSDQIEVEATAYLWSGAPIVKIPDDLPENLALSALDVCGAPAQTARLVAGQQRVLILGAGKSGMLCAAAARDVLPFGSIYGFDLHEKNLKRLKDAGLIDVYRTGDATKPTDVLAEVLDMSGGESMDVVINTCNVPNSEMSAILCCRDRGKVYFFNMATSFAKAALGCEGVGKDVDLLIGNGFAHGHAELTLDVVRKHPVVREAFEELLIVKCDVAIVGGGIIGLSIARDLIDAGLDVKVITTDRLGAASNKAAGMLAPISEAKEIEPELAKISLESLERWPEFANALQEQSGIALDFVTAGSLNVAIDADHHRALKHIKAQHDTLGLSARFLDSEETLELEPNLTPRVFSSLHCPDEHHVNPVAILDALRRCCDPVTQVGRATRVTSDGVWVTTDAGEVRVEAKRTIIASGAWSPTIDGLDRLNVRPIRGQMIHVKSDTPLASRPIRTPDVYLVPRNQNELVIGSTMEEVGFDAAQTFGALMEISRDAWETIPGLYDAQWLGTWSGFRPVAFDNLPIVGRSDTQPHLFYATGHGRGGVLLTPWTVHTMRKLILESLS